MPPLIISVCNVLFSHNAQEIFDILLNVTFKDGTSGYDDVRACIQNHLEVILLDTAVYLNICIQPFLIQHLTKLLDLLGGFRNISLSAKARFYRHEKDHICHIQYVGLTHCSGSLV